MAAVLMLNDYNDIFRDGDNDNLAHAAYVDKDKNNDDDDDDKKIMMMMMMMIWIMIIMFICC